jgi:hypothetical protein
LNLESNQLSGDGEDNLGITELVLGLQSNKSLLSLNLANNKLEAPIGAAIRAMLEINTTLIDLEVGFNLFALADVRI